MSADDAGPPVRRRPGRVRRWVVRPFIWGFVLVAVLIAAALFFLQSRYARHQLAARLIAAVSEKIGRPVQVGDVDYTFFPLSLELRDVVIPGPGPADPAVARIPLARVQATWRDLQQRVVRLDQVEAIRPQIYVRIDPDGTTNLPRWRTGPRGPRRFEVQIGRILVQDGTFQLNEQRVRLQVDAKAVWGRVTGQAERAGEGGERLDALVTAQEVVTRLPDANPWPATISAKATIFPSEGRIRITQARIAGPDLSAEAGGEVLYRGKEKRVALDVEARGETPLLNRLGYLKEPIEGPFGFQGRVRVQGRQVLYGGTLTSPRLAILSREFRGIEAALSGGRERIEVDLRRAEYAGGRIEGPIGIPFQDEGRPGTQVELDLTLAGLGLQPLIQDQFPGEDIPVVSGLAGRVRGTLTYDFDSREPLAGSGFADLRVEAVQQAGGLPLSGDLPITIEEGVLSSDDLQITAPGQDLRIAGFLFDLQRVAGRLSYQLESSDLGRLAPLLLEDVPPGEDPPFWIPTQGQGTLAGDVTIDRSRYVAGVQLDLRNAVTPDLAAEVVRGSLRLRPGAVEDLQLALTSGPGTLTVSGQVPLAEEGERAPRAPLALQIAADRWPASSVAGFLLPADLLDAKTFGGRVTGRLALRGFPDALQGEATADVADLAVADQRVGQAHAEVAFEGSQIRLRRVAIQTEAGNVLIAGVFGGTGPDGGGSLDFTLDAPALALAAPPFRDLFGGRLDGRLAVAAVVGGTLERPEATVRVMGSQLVLAGRPLGEGGNPGTAQALLAWDGADLRATGSLLGLVSFDGGGRLDRAGADLELDVSSQDLAALARLAAPQPVPDFAGSFLGTLGFDADFARGAWRSELRLADLRLQYEGHQIANLEPVVAALEPERLTIESLYLSEPQTGSDLFVAGTVGHGGATTPLDHNVQSTIAAAWAELFVPQLDVDGAVDVLATIKGTAEAPVLNGQGEIRDARLVIPNFPHELENIRGTLQFNRDAVELEQLSAKLGGGELRAVGRLEIPKPGEPLDYRLQVAAENLSLRYPEGFLARGDADLTFVSTGDNRVIRGDVRLNRLFYVEDVEVGTLELLRGAFQRQRVEVAETDEVLATTQLNVRVTGQQPGALRVNNNVANLRGDIDLFVRGTLANPVLFGQVELEPGGQLIYADNEYEVERGLLTFNNYYRIDPVIDLVARTEVRNYDITLSLSGTLERLNAQFSSEEGLADLEILALLATGQELPGEGRFTAPGERTESNVRASEILAGQATSLISARVGTLFGFDRFRIDPQPSPSGGAVGGVRLTVGKKISRDLFVTYTTNPSSSEEYVVRVEWQLSDKVLLVLTRDGKEDLFALDAEWEKRF